MLKPNVRYGLLCERSSSYLLLSINAHIPKTLERS